MTAPTAEARPWDDERGPDDAPCWYDADSASGWSAGYNAAVSRCRALSAVPDDGLGSSSPEGAKIPTEYAAEVCSRLEDLLSGNDRFHPVGCSEWEERARVAIDMAKDFIQQAAPSPSAPTGDAEGAVVGGWNGLGEPQVGQSRIVIGADDPLYQAFRPSREAIVAIEKSERANAQALAAIRDMMVGHVTNWPNPKGFGTALSLIDKTLHAARQQAAPATPAGSE